MVYLVKPNYPLPYLDSNKRAYHAVSFGSSVGPKYYYGNKAETLWSQEIHKKAMNTQENMYLLQVEKGTHKSLPLYETVYGHPIIQPDMMEYTSEPVHKSKGSSKGMMRHMSDKEQRLHDTVNWAKDLNGALLGQLSAVQSTMDRTHDALDDLEYKTFGRTSSYSQRSRSRLRPQSAMSRAADLRTPKSRPHSALSRGSRGQRSSRPRTAFLRTGNTVQSQR